MTTQNNQTKTQLTLHELREQLRQLKVHNLLSKSGNQHMTFDEPTIDNILALFTQQLELIVSELEQLNDCEDGCKHKDTHVGHNRHWWMGYTQALSEAQKLIRGRIG